MSRSDFQPPLVFESHLPQWHHVDEGLGTAAMDEIFSINTKADDGLERTAVTRDSFSEEWSAIPYVNEAFKLNLNKLIHLSPYSEVLLISGPVGVGKSILLQQFVITAKKSWKAIHIRASSLMSTEDFLRQIVHGFGLPRAGVDDAEDMLSEIGRYLQALARSGRRAIVAIDDAHLLTDEVLVMVEHMLSDERSTNAVSLVLVAENESVPSRFGNFPVLLHKLAYTLQLEPFAKDDVAPYIHHRLAHTNNLGLEPVFDERLVAQLYEKSAGLAGRINELARRQLDKRRGQKGAATSGGKRLLRWGLALVGVAAIAAILLFQDRINQLVAVAPTHDKAGSAANGVAPSEHAAPAIAETKAAAEGGSAAPEGPAVAAAAPEVKESETVAEATPQPATPALSMGQLGESQDRMGAVSETETAAPETAAAETTDSGTAAQPKPESRPEPPATVAAVSTTPAAPKAPAAPPKAPAAAKPPAPPKSPAPPQPAAPPAAKPAAKVVAKRGWLESQAPEHFTLQLMALSDGNDVKHFVERNKLQGQSAIYQISRKGKRLSVLVYGSYADRAAANAAAASLPKGWRIRSPWVRSFASVLEDAKGN